MSEFETSTINDAVNNSKLETTEDLINRDELSENIAISSVQHTHNNRNIREVTSSRFGRDFPANIILIGFMGTGKTTIGQVLAHQCGYGFLDTDCLVETLSGKTVADIWKEDGESRFRELETEVLKNLVGIKNMVISTGGGLPIKEDNWSYLRKIGKTIFLETPPKILLERLTQSPLEQRPLLANREFSVESINELLKKRLPFYYKADISIPTAYSSTEPVGLTIIYNFLEMIDHTINPDIKQSSVNIDDF